MHPRLSKWVGVALVFLAAAAIARTPVGEIQEPSAADDARPATLLDSKSRPDLAATRPADGRLDQAPTAPLPFPVYVASRIAGPVTVDGQLIDPAWRETALGWGLSHAMEPNVLCPDATLFRIGYDDEHLYIALACYKRDVQDNLPAHIWRPQETELIDTQAMPRHARERGVAPPVNTAQVLISKAGRTVTLTFAPPEPPTARVHDSLGDRELKLKLDSAYHGGPKDELWTAETRIAWAELGFAKPAEGEDWALNVYRDIRFFSNWSFIAWMRDWGKAEYSRYEMTDRFGRMLFAGRTPDAGAVEALATKLVARRGPVRVFTGDAMLRVDGDGQITRQRYADHAKVLRAYAARLRDQRGQIGNDLPYHPFYPQSQPGEHLQAASRKLTGLAKAASDKPLLDDPACEVARISHAIPEARQGLYTYKKERLYRGLPE